MKTGLVLSGGGARGAYQAGVLKVMCDAGITIDMISGASIGALNAGVLAAAPNFTVGVDRVGQLWNELAKESPLTPDYLGYLTLAAHTIASGRSFRSLLNLDWLGGECSLLSDRPLRRLMAKYLDLDGLASGLPLYVSVFESAGALQDGLQAALAEIGMSDTPPSDFLHLQSLPREDWQDALLASAALPGIFRTREIQGKNYVDGGIGGWHEMQGNTPVKPLIDAGCERIVVIHLNDDAAWDRSKFIGIDFIEIRPDSGVFDNLTDMLDFDANKIRAWRRAGERDAKQLSRHNPAFLVRPGRRSANRTTAPRYVIPH